MSLVRVWRRQLYGASIAALIVPTAMVAALIALALGGAFSGVGVLGQLFAGPSLSGAGGGLGAASSGGHGGAARPVTTASLPVIPGGASPVGSRRGVAAARRAPGVNPVGRGVGRSVGRGVGRSVGRGVTGTGEAIAPVGGTVRPVSQGSGGSAGGQGTAPVHNPSAGSGSGSGSGSPAPQPSPPPPSPPPQPTPVDKVVTVVTSVTQQVPAPVGPLATQVVQAAGSAVDNLLPVSRQPAS